MQTLPILAALAAAAALSACADYYEVPPGPVAAAPAYGVPAAATVPASCFYSRDIRNHTVADDHTLYLNVGGSEVYRVGMSGACLAGAGAGDPLIITHAPPSGSICRPIDLDVAVQLGGANGLPSHCIVSSLERLGPDAVAALPAKLRP